MGHTGVNTSQYKRSTTWQIMLNGEQIQRNPIATRNEAGLCVHHSWVLKPCLAPGTVSQTSSLTASRWLSHMVNIVFATSSFWPLQYTQTNRMKSAVPTGSHFPPLPPCVACDPETPNHTPFPNPLPPTNENLPLQAFRSLLQSSFCLSPGGPERFHASLTN